MGCAGDDLLVGNPGGTTARTCRSRWCRRGSRRSARSATRKRATRRAAATTTVAAAVKSAVITRVNPGFRDPTASSDDVRARAKAWLLGDGVTAVAPAAVLVELLAWRRHRGG